MILLNNNWQSVVKRIIDFFIRLQVVIFVNVLFVDAWKFVYVWTEHSFTGDYPTEEERSLNLIVRVSQGMIGLIICIIINLLWENRQRSLLR